MATVAVRVNRREDGVGYQLGVDIGTTHTAAAVLRQGQAQMATLGDDSASIPSVVFLGTDDVVVVGDAASELGFSDPARVARAFKRRLGDPTPIALGGTSHPVDDLLAKLLRRVVDIVSEREGARPDLVTVTHPANWGAYRIDLFNEVIRSTGLEGVRTMSDPEAVTVFHRSTEATTEGDVVLVYDLGGGTFDAYVARQTSEGVEVLGTPEGIDRLGGIDFDEAVLAHMSGAVGVSPADFERDDPATLGALARLRVECAVVKETLSTSTEVSVPVFLPGGEREVRVTRDDLEAMVRPALTETIEVVRRTLRSAHLQPSDVDVVVLAGGSSRIPLVAQLVSEALGRPVAVTDEPKHAVALGAALSMVSWAAEHDPAPVVPALAEGAGPGPPSKSPATAAEATASTPPPDPAAADESTPGTTTAADARPEPESSSAPTSSSAPATSAETNEAGKTVKPAGPTDAEETNEAGKSVKPAGPTDAGETNEAGKPAEADTSTATSEATASTPATPAEPGPSPETETEIATETGTETKSKPRPDPRGKGHPSEGSPSYSMSLGMSIATVLAALVMIGAAAAAGSLIGARRVSAGIGLAVAAAAAGVVLLLMVKRPSAADPEPPGTIDRPEESSL